MTHWILLLAESKVHELEHHDDERLFEQLNTFKPNCIHALINNTFLSELHQTLHDLSKTLSFKDMVYNHPHTKTRRGLKEKVADIVTEWYGEYLNTIHKTSQQFNLVFDDYPLTVLLPVMLDLIIPHTTNSDELDDKMHHASRSELPLWGGEFNNIIHTNKCSVDNILAFIRINFPKIQHAFTIIGVDVFNTELSTLLKYIENRYYPEARNLIAEQLSLETTREFIITCYNFHGSEGPTIQLLRKLYLCNDTYNSSLQCYSCNKKFYVKLKLEVLDAMFTIWKLH